MKLRSVSTKQAVVYTPLGGTINMLLAGSRIPMPAGGLATARVDVVELAYEAGEFDIVAYTGGTYSSWQAWAAAFSLSNPPRLTIQMPTNDFALGDAFVCVDSLYVPVRIIAINAGTLEIIPRGLHTGTTTPVAINYFGNQAMVLIQDRTAETTQFATFGDSSPTPDISSLSGLPFSQPHANHLPTTRTVMATGIIPAINPPSGMTALYPPFPYKRYEVVVPHIYSIRNGFAWDTNIAQSTYYPKTLYISIFPYRDAQAEIFEVITDYPNRDIITGSPFALQRPALTANYTGTGVNVSLSKPSWVSGSFQAFAFLVCDETAHGTTAISPAAQLLNHTALTDTGSAFVGFVPVINAHLSFSPKVVGAIVWQSGSQIFAVYSDPYEIPLPSDDTWDFVSNVEDANTFIPYKNIKPYDGLYMYARKTGAELSWIGTSPRVEVRLYGVLPSGALELLERWDYNLTEYDVIGGNVYRRGYSPRKMEMVQRNRDGTTIIHRPNPVNSDCRLEYKAEVNHPNITGGGKFVLAVNAYAYARRYIQTNAWTLGATTLPTYGSSAYLAKFSHLRLWVGFFGNRTITGHRDEAVFAGMLTIDPYDPFGTPLLKTETASAVNYQLVNRESWRITLHSSEITADPIAQVYYQSGYTSPNQPNPNADGALTLTYPSVQLNKNALPDGIYRVYFRGLMPDYSSNIAMVDTIVIQRGTEEVVSTGETACCYKMPALAVEELTVVSRDKNGDSTFANASFSTFAIYKGNAQNMANRCFALRDFCGVEIVARIPSVFVDIVGYFDNRVLGKAGYDNLSGQDVAYLARFIGVVRRVSDEVAEDEYITISKLRRSIYRQYKRQYEIEVVLPSPCAVNMLDVLKLASRWKIKSRNEGIQVEDIVIPDTIDFSYRDGIYTAKITAKQVIWGDEMRY